MNSLPSLRQLRYLVALADHGHFARAAEACNVTQSTLSVGIQELEIRLDAALVERRGRRTLLTPLGADIAGRARALLVKATDLVETARSAREPLTGTIRLGVIPTVSPYLLPRILPDLRRRYPKLQLYLTEDLSDRIATGLEEGRLDVLLLALPYELPGAKTMMLFSDPFVFACRDDHPLAGERLVSVERLADQSLLLLQDGHCLSDQAIAACRLANRRGRAPFAATSLPTLIQMVDNGLGVTLLPTLAIEAGAIDGTSIRGCPLAGEPPPGREIALAWRRGSPRAAEFRMLGEAIAALAGSGGRIPADNRLAATR